MPAVLIGYMGKDDRAQKGLGAALIVEAARRVVRNRDVAAWGIVLDAEGGRDNQKLWSWYQSLGFTPARLPEYPRLMYAPFSVLLG